MSGSDVARLALRAVIGTTMVAHGVRHGRTLGGTARWFGSIGFRRPTEPTGCHRDLNQYTLRVISLRRAKGGMGCTR